MLAYQSQGIGSPLPRRWDLIKNKGRISPQPLTPLSLCFLTTMMCKPPLPHHLLHTTSGPCDQNDACEPVSRDWPFLLSH